jgi:Zn-dependent metalloprotease
MSQRILAIATSAAALVALTGVAVAQPAAATPQSPPRPRQPAGHSAFTEAPFTLDPSPPVRKRAVSRAKDAIAAHPGRAHRAGGQKFTVRSVAVDRDGSADVRFDRTYRGLPVYGGDLVVHLKPNGSYQGLETASDTSGAIGTTPSVRAPAAARLARKQLKGTVSSVSKPKLAITMQGRSATLVWQTVVTGVRADRTPSKLHVMVDARKGGVVQSEDEVHTFVPGGVQSAPSTAARTALTQGSGHGLYVGTVNLDLTQSGGTWTMRDPSHGNGYTTNLNHATSGTGTIFSNSTGEFGNGSNSDPASAGVDAH